MTEPGLKRLSLQTVGCRLNQYETEKMAADLAPYGFRRVKRGEVADLYIINTCTVTHRADADNRYLISRASRENPNARIVVAGCYVTNNPDFQSHWDTVDVVVPNEDKARLVEILSERLPELFRGASEGECPSTPMVRFEQLNRAWLKVSDGCNQRCAFCVLPSVRGHLLNREPDELVDEINELVQQGFEEIVLTGLNLGLYRSIPPHRTVRDLTALCRLFLEYTDVRRIRLSSIEPQTVSEGLLDLLAGANGRLCRHLHMPLQSGSDRILRLMGRPYSQADYIERVRLARRTLPEIVIGADVIVGFPGESDEDFRDTRHVADSGLLDYLHVFSYSDRPGTKASAMPDKVAPRVVRTRNEVLVRSSKLLRAECNRRQVGRVLGVIAEHKKPAKGQFWGVADNFIKVKLPLDYGGGRRIASYEVTAAYDSYVDGRLHL